MRKPHTLFINIQRLSEIRTFTLSPPHPTNSCYCKLEGWDMKTIKNTDPRFFEKWDRDTLNYEAARLNRLLEDMKKILKRISYLGE